MAEEVPRDAAGKTHDPEIASADLLFQDEPAKRPSKPAANPAASAGPGEVFDLVDTPDVEVPAPRRP